MKSITINDEQADHALQGWSKDPNLKFEGTMKEEALSTMLITINEYLYEVQLNEQGYWEWTIPQGLVEGVHVIDFRLIDQSGNLGEARQFILHLDYNAPEQPEILRVKDDVGSQTGNLTSGDISDDLQPEIIGVAEPGSTVTIYDGAKILGTTKADTNGRWIFEADLEPGQYDLRVTATDRLDHTSIASESFKLNLVSPEGNVEYDLKITHAWDNYGSSIGRLDDGSITDDRTPTLYGEGKAGETAYLYYRTKGASSWLVVEKVVIDNQGKWVLDSDRLPAGEYQFAVSYSATTPVITETFDLQIIAPESLIPVIVDAWDNAGSITGVVLDGQDTNDNTPQLRGYAEANSIVYVKYYSDAEPGNILLGSTLSNSAGKWIYTPPIPLTQDHWHFSAGNSLVDNAMSPIFSLNIIGFERINSLYDFNDIERILVTNRVNEIVYRDLTFTNLTKGEKNSGLYTDEWPKQGNLGVMMQTPAFNKAVEYSVEFKHGVEKISFTAVDWKTKSCYVAFYDNGGNEVGRIYAKTAGIENTEYFTFSSATPFTSMKIHLQNLGGYSRIDNLDVDYQVEHTSTRYDFNDIEKITESHSVSEIHYRDLVLTDINHANGKGGLYTDYWPYQNNLGVIMITPAFNISAEYLVNFKQGAKQISFTAMDWKTKSCYVAFYDESGNEVGRVYAQTSGVKNTEYFSFSSDVPFTSMKIHLQNLGGFSRIDNLEIDYEVEGEVKLNTPVDNNQDHDGSNVMGYLLEKDEYNSITLRIEDSEYKLHMDKLNELVDNVGRFDMKNGAETKLTVELKELLTTGHENLFINDGRKQLMISGDEGDVLQIKGINDGDVIDNWLQAGKVTVAGVNYDVYLSGQNNEILIEEGIITQTY